MAEFTDGIAVGMAIVRPTGGIVVPKTLVENGIYYAADDDADGYSPVTVAVPIGGKMITKNGVYHAADDDLRGYDPVNVSVPMYWTFQPGETVPPSMITPDTHIEEDAPPSPDDMPYPTPEDPQRVIKPRFKFVNNGRILRTEDNQYMSDYGGQLYDEDTGELLGQAGTGHPWGDNEKFIILSWNYTNGILNVEFTYDWYDPGVTFWDHLDFGINTGTYTPSSDSGQNKTTIYGG
jgi:hypothetical protein